MSKIKRGNGRDKARPKTRQITVKLSEDTITELDRMSAETGENRSEILRRIVAGDLSPIRTQ